jgi:hypothetical protein
VREALLAPGDTDDAATQLDDNGCSSESGSSHARVNCTRIASLIAVV